MYPNSSVFDYYISYLLTSPSKTPEAVKSNNPRLGFVFNSLGTGNYFLKKTSLDQLLFNPACRGIANAVSHSLWYSHWKDWCQHLLKMGQPTGDCVSTYPRLFVFPLTRINSKYKKRLVPLILMGCFRQDTFSDFQSQTCAIQCLLLHSAPCTTSGSETFPFVSPSS